MAIFHKYKPIYQSPDNQVIYDLLKEIGHYEYFRQLEQKHLLEQKPILRRDFFLEAKQDGIHLCYRYPQAECSIMLVEGYVTVPMEGWKLLKNEDF